MLGLDEMRIERVSVDFEKTELRLELTYRTAFCDCTVCGEKGTGRERKREPRQHPVRHLDCFEFKTLLHFDNVEMECSSCGVMFNRRPSFLGDSHNVTMARLQDWMVKAKGTAVKTLAEWNDENPRTAADMYYRELGKADANRTPRQVEHLGIDEVSMLKGGTDYVLLLYDLDEHEIIEVLPDRTKEVLIPYLEEHREDMFAELKVVCTDMWRHYRDAVKAVFPGVKVVADRFHVEQQLNEALDECRLAVQRRLEDLDERREWKKCYRHVLLRAHETQVERPGGYEELQYVLGQDKELKRLYWLKEQFRQIYALNDYEDARTALNLWIRRATYLGSKFLNPFIQTVKNWKKPILEYVRDGLTNGVSEGFNCKVKLVKRMAYGFRNFSHFRLRILHTCSQTLG